MTRVHFLDGDSDERAFASELDVMYGPLRERFGECPRPDVLRAAESDVLPAAAAASVRAHVAACAMCRMLAKDLTDIPVVGLSDAERERIRRRVTIEAEASRARRARHRRARWAGAASAMAVAASVLLALLPSAPISVPSVQPPPRPPVPTVHAASVLGIDKPPIRLPLTIALSMRGAANDPSISELQDAVARYRADDFAGAAEALSHLVPNTSLPQLGVYLGVSYLHTGDPSNAERALTTALTTPLDADLADDARWYLAVADVRLGDITAARTGLDRLCRGSGARAMQACAASAELTR